MRLELKLHGALARGRAAKGPVEAPAGCTAAGLLDLLGLERAGVGVIVINGRDACLDQPLAHGDRVSLIPAVTGG